MFFLSSTLNLAMNLQKILLYCCRGDVLSKEAEKLEISCFLLLFYLDFHCLRQQSINYSLIYLCTPSSPHHPCFYRISVSQLGNNSSYLELFCQEAVG